MAAKSRMSTFSLLVVLVVILISSIAEKSAAIRIIPHNAARFRPLHTIYSDDGDVIDCIDIYQQPAFSNPILKGHRIKMEPTNYIKQEVNDLPQQQWHKSGSCPQDTIPIPRHIYGTNITEPVFFRPVLRKLPGSRQEDASAFVTKQRPYYGTEAQLFSFSAPTVMPNEFSMSYVALGSKINSTFEDPKKGLDYPDIKNVVSAGYMVYPNVNSDSQPRTFVYYNNPIDGCFNLDCGFIQVNSHFAIGAINPLTIDISNALDVQIQKDDAQGLWWVSFNRQVIGYYPIEIFEGFYEANVVQWGGLILNTFPDEAHTATAMGSGKIVPSVQADMIGEVSVITKTGVELVIHPDGINIPYPGCYSLIERVDLLQPAHGFYFSYGGSGFPHCDG